MSDYNSSLPVRTENPGDVIVKLADATVPSQQLAISAAGEASVNLTSAANFGSISGGAAGSLSALAGGIYNSVLPTLTDGQQSAIQLDSSSRLIISPLTSIQVTNFPAIVDVNYGVVGASTLRSAAQIGNASGAADFNAGATGAQTLRVIANQGAANATPWNQNIAQIAGSSPSAANSLPVQLTDGAAFYSDSNPLPVKFAQEGTVVNDFKMAAAVASGASDNHDYTAVGNFYLNQIEASASGKAKIIVAIESGVATGTFNTRFVQFNSTAETNMSIVLADSILVAAGVRVRISISNRDLSSQDLYSTISGLEA